MTTQPQRPDYSAVSWEEIREAMNLVGLDEWEIRGSGYGFTADAVRNARGSG